MIGDWYIQNETGQLYVVDGIDDGVLIAPVEDVELSLGEPIAVAGGNLDKEYQFISPKETVDDILEEYADYDYDRKFYRIGFVGLACRIKRALDNTI